MHVAKAATVVCSTSAVSPSLFLPILPMRGMQPEGSLIQEKGRKMKTEWPGREKSRETPQMVGQREPWNEEVGRGGHRSKEEISVVLCMIKGK